MGKKIKLKETQDSLAAFYCKSHGVNFEGVSEEEVERQIKDLELFPKEWWSKEFGLDFSLKIEILSRAINQDILISETDYYKEHMKDKTPGSEDMKVSE